jgi:hypothetical protein
VLVLACLATPIRLTDTNTFAAEDKEAPNESDRHCVKDSLLLYYWCFRRSRGQISVGHVIMTCHLSCPLCSECSYSEGYDKYLRPPPLTSLGSVAFLFGQHPRSGTEAGRLLL